MDACLQSVYEASERWYGLIAPALLRFRGRYQSYTIHAKMCAELPCSRTACATQSNKHSEINQTSADRRVCLKLEHTQGHQLLSRHHVGARNSDKCCLSCAAVWLSGSRNQNQNFSAAGRCSPAAVFTTPGAPGNSRSTAQGRDGVVGRKGLRLECQPRSDSMLQQTWGAAASTAVLCRKWPAPRLAGASAAGGDEANSQICKPAAQQPLRAAVKEGAGPGVFQGAHRLSSDKFP